MKGTKQLSELGAVVDCWCSYLRRERDRNQELSLDDIVGGLAEHLIRFLCRFKDCKWKKEKEWRLVYMPEVGNLLEVKCRDSERGEVCHVELNLSVEISSHGAEIGKLPIREVMHGPTSDPELAKRSLELLLCQHEYITVPVRGSDIPL
jgi:hypothetical protein